VYWQRSLDCKSSAVSYMKHRACAGGYCCFREATTAGMTSHCQCTWTARTLTRKSQAGHSAPNFTSRSYTPMAMRGPFTNVSVPLLPYEQVAYSPYDCFASLSISPIRGLYQVQRRCTASTSRSRTGAFPTFCRWPICTTQCMASYGRMIRFASKSVSRSTRCRAPAMIRGRRPAMLGFATRVKFRLSVQHAV
jgi:hypothetical protein